MSYWDNLCRTPLLHDTLDEANAVSDRLNFVGFDSTVCFYEDQYVVSVPQDQADKAWDYLHDYWLDDESRKKADDEYRQNVLKHSPQVVPSEEKFKTSTNCSTVFLIAGLIVIIMAIVHFIFSITDQTQFTSRNAILELFLGFIFISFGVSTQQKVRMLENRIKEENSFTNQIVDWCTTVYSAQHLDKCIDAAAESPLSEEERFNLRRELIQDYILREYDIPDSAYLDFLTDLIYKKLYYPHAVSA